MMSLVTYVCANMIKLLFLFVSSQSTAMIIFGMLPPVYHDGSSAPTSGKHVQEVCTPSNPNFYIVKLGYAGVHPFFSSFCSKT